jgi:hypothetical protein
MAVASKPEVASHSEVATIAKIKKPKLTLRYSFEGDPKPMATQIPLENFGGRDKVSHRKETIITRYWCLHTIYQWRNFVPI